jgi:hypothetical protein
MVSSVIQLEYGIETYYFMKDARKNELLPMAHLINHIVSQLGGLLNVMCDLLMANKYLDTAIKLYTQQHSKLVAYSFPIFTAVIVLVSIISMTDVLVRLNY